jgi:hypothetical protein
MPKQRIVEIHKMSSVWLLILCCPTFAQSQSHTRSIVHLGCDSPAVNGLDQIEVIARATQEDRKTSKLRVSWYDTLGSGADIGTLLYDRRSRTLKYYEVLGAGYGNEWKVNNRFSYLFTRVTDGVLARAAALRDSKAPQQMPQLAPFSLLTILPRLGCGKKELPLTFGQRFK